MESGTDFGTKFKRSWAGRPNPHLSDQCDRRIALQRLGIEQLVVSHRNGVDRQLIDTVGVRRELDAGILEELASAIHGYIDLLHNDRRRHSAIGMLSPTEYEDLRNTTGEAA